MLISKEKLLEALPEEMPQWNADDWTNGYNDCLEEIIHIIENFGKDEGEDEV